MAEKSTPYLEVVPDEKEPGMLALDLVWREDGMHRQLAFRIPTALAKSWSFTLLQESRKADKRAGVANG